MNNTDNPEILFEDNHLIAVNKKPSDIVQGDITGDEPLSEKIKSYLKKKYDKTGDVFLGVIHRLDRPVSGVVLFAKTSKALSRMNQLFKDREVKKIYWAIVKNQPPENNAELVNNLAKNEKMNKSFVVSARNKHAPEARLKYSVIGKSDRYYFLEVKPETGRHHQIRVQLAHIKCPIRGDLKYGYDRSNTNAGIDLHARKLIFEHPVSKENVEIIAPVPDEKLWHIFEDLNKDQHLHE